MTEPHRNPSSTPPPVTDALEAAFVKGADVAVFIANQRQNPQPPSAHQLDEIADFVVAVREALAARSNQEATPDARTVEEIISAWAFAYDIDGAARNDLFARLRVQAVGDDDAAR